MALPLYQSFPAIALTGLICSILATIATPPVTDEVLIRFYTQVAPRGFWRDIIKKAISGGHMTKEEAGRQMWEKINDGIALCFAVPFQTCMLLAGMAFIFHDWSKFSFLAIMSVFCGIGLYFFWFRNLRSNEECDAEDARWKAVELPQAPASKDK